MLIDAHMHLFPPDVIARRDTYAERDPGFGALYRNPRARMAAAEDAISEMERAGLDRAIAVGFGWADSGLCSAHNDYLADAARRYPDRLAVFGCIQPAAVDVDREVDRCARLGMKGIGELMPHLQGFDLADECRMGPLAEAAAALGLIVMTHSSEPVGHQYAGKGDVTPEALLSFVQRWPELTVVASHWGGGLPFYELMPEVRAVTDRLYYDTAATTLLYDPRIYRVVADLVGAKRILFGTDYPLLKPASQMKRLSSVGLTESQTEFILGGNAARLLGLISP